MKLEDIDGSVFAYNPKQDSELRRLEQLHDDFNFPLQSGIKTLKKTILRYIILQYDKNTPLRYYYPNYYKRKMNAAVMAGFPRNAKTGRFSESVKDILIGNNDGVNRAIVRYVMQFFDNDYLMLVLWNEILGSRAADLMKTKNDKNLSQTHIKAIKDIRVEIDTLTQKVFGGKENKNLEEELYKALEVEKDALHPDWIANQLSEGEELFKGEVDE